MNDLTAQKQSKSNLPAQLKANIEAMSGFSMDDVRVHYNSSKPAQMKALAYTQGTDIHVGPGQEKHLGHEAWHVVQQKQGRVAPTAQLKGVNVNTDEALEHEADVMGARASVFSAPASPVVQRKPVSGAQGATVQFIKLNEFRRRMSELNWTDHQAHNGSHPYFQKGPYRVSYSEHDIKKAGAVPFYIKKEVRDYEHLLGNPTFTTAYFD